MTPRFGPHAVFAAKAAAFTANKIRPLNEAADLLTPGFGPHAVFAAKAATFTANIIRPLNEAADLLTPGFGPVQFLPQKLPLLRQTKSAPSLRGRIRFISAYLTIFSQKRIRMVATWARVAVSCGLRVVLLVPVIRPVPTAHCRAVRAYPFTRA